MLAPGERDAAAVDRGEPQDGPAQGRLPRAGLADQADGLPPGRMSMADALRARGRPPADALGGVFDDEIVDDEQGLGHGRWLLRRHQGCGSGIRDRGRRLPVQDARRTATWCRGGGGRRRWTAAGPVSTIRPSCMTETRSQRSATTPKLCVTMQDGHAELLLEVAQQVEDLGLDGDVERGGRLVGDDQARVAGDRPGDQDALRHAAGQLVRVTGEGPLGDRVMPTRAEQAPSPWPWPRFSTGRAGA